MSFLNLPDEIINMICEKLESVVDLVSFFMCSKRLNYICKNVSRINDVYEISKQKIKS